MAEDVVQTISLIDWILTMALVAAVWRMYDTIQPQSHAPGEAEPPGAVSGPRDAKGDPVQRKLQRVRDAGGFGSIEDFVRGARHAYEAVVTAYGAGETASLAAMFAPDVREAFDEAIAGRAARGETLTMIFIGLVSATPVDAGMEEGRCWISVRFVAQRVSATTDRDGNVIDGHPRRVDEVAEIWTFARAVGSRDPNWVLVATGEEA